MTADERRQLITRILAHRHLEILTDVVLQSGMTLDETRLLVGAVAAWLELAAGGTGAIPSMTPIAHLPAVVQHTVRARLIDAIAFAVSVRTPTGRPH